jgi:hypothetical protein
MWNLLKPFVGPIALLALKEGLSKSGHPMSEFQAGLLVGFAAFWFVLALISHRALFRRVPGIRAWLPFIDPIGASSKELSGRYISQQTFAVADLVLDGKIEGRTFEDCEIYGPAVLVLSGVGQMYKCGFDHPAAFITANQEHVVGPILVKDCSFKQCRFHGVGFIGPEETIKKFKSGTKT